MHSELPDSALRTTKAVTAPLVDPRASDIQPRVELPEGYYLDHFRYFLGTVRDLYTDCLTSAELTLLHSFGELSEAEQRLFVRLVNRAGTVFFRSTLRYPEIPSVSTQLDLLLQKGFLRSATPEDFPLCAPVMRKSHLTSLLNEHGLAGDPSKDRWSKSELLARVLEYLPGEHFAASQVHADIVIQGFVEETRYLMFLVFGDLRFDLKLYALRDMGIWRDGAGIRSPTRRFESFSHAKSEYFFRSSRARLPSLSQAELEALAQGRSGWPVAVGAGAEKANEELLGELSQRLLRAGSVESGLEVLRAARSAPLVEKRIRVLATSGLMDAVRAELQSIFEDPPSADLLLFAEDFFARKFGGAKKSLVTQALENGRRVRLSARHRGRPEQGVIELLELEGFRAKHTENDLWLGLFGMTFWHELFEADSRAIYSEFERVPRDLLENTFWKRHADTVGTRLLTMSAPDTAESWLRVVASRHSDEPNGIFRWRAGFIEELVEFVHCCLIHRLSLAPVLARMGQSFERNRSGFPDLLVYDGTKPFFAEVKSLGDKLQPAQLRQLRLLSEIGFRTEVIRADWVYDPDQIYVVIDVETTGMSSAHHRITEIGALKIQNGEVIGVFSTLINPESRIPNQIVTLTGITNEMVSTAPLFQEIARDLEAFLENTLFVAHNASFDYGFISAEFRRSNILFRCPTLCTCTAMRRAYPGLESYGLGSLCGEFGITLSQHHRALCDAEATAELLQLILQKQSSVSALTPIPDPDELCYSGVTQSAGQTSRSEIAEHR